MKFDVSLEIQRCPKGHWFLALQIALTVFLSLLHMSAYTLCFPRCYRKFVNMKFVSRKFVKESC